MEPDEKEPHRGSEDYEIRRQQALERWPIAMQAAKTRKLEERDAESVSDASLVESLSSRYEDIRPLDGRRATFRARDRQSGKPVQLKVRRHVSRAPQFTDVLRALRTIPQRYRCGIQDDIALRDDTAVLVMDWLEGDTLKERLDANCRLLREDDVRVWMEHICEAMTFLAADGIVHRNLKPANIVIDANNVAHVNDFSLAAFAGSENRACGTLSYAAPEQLTDDATVSTCFDIYGFGATFYHALAGEAPFKPGLDRIIGKAGMKPDDSKDLTQTLPGSVATILDRCLEAEPRRRFQSFVELRTQLESQRPANVIYPSISQPPEVPGCVILSELGRGGMGVVYKALDLQSDQYVAIKFIRAYGDANLDQLARFRIEAEAVALLRHRNIVPVVRMGVAIGYPYIVLEYASGGSLASRMREGSLDPVRAASVAEDIAGGLAHAHRLSILHRDLKPQNILLTDAGVARITDFGLAKITATGRARQHLRDASILPGIDGSLLGLMRFRGGDRAMNPEDMKRRIEETVDVARQECGPSLGDAATVSEVREFLTDVVEQSFEATEDPFGHEETEPTREGQIIGTPMYMAPEQTYGDMSQLGRPTDIYSLGVILYEMLSGSVPHRATRMNDLFHQIRFDAPPPLHRRVPLTLRNICEKCLAKPPGDRYQSANSLADELRAFLESDEAEVAARRAANEGRIRKKVGSFLRGLLPFPNGR